MNKDTEMLYRDFTVCENCGGNCYLGNKFCEDCANKLFADMTEKYNACQEARKQEIEFSMQDKNELRQQLAEKDKEIETKNTALKLCREYMFNIMCSEDVPSEEWFIKCANEEENRLLEIIKAKDKEIESQDKIDYAVEQLERVKEFCENWKRIEPYFEYVIIKETSGVRCVPALYEFIDQLITEIKEGK